MTYSQDKKLIIGREEWCAFPELNIPAIKARIDSGAKTSCIHAVNIESFWKKDIKWVRFDVYPMQNNRRNKIHCEAKLIDKRHVKSSSGEKEKRYVIETLLVLGNEEWTIQATLTNRDSMSFRMLLGREAMNGRVLIDPAQKMLQGGIPPFTLDID